MTSFPTQLGYVSKSSLHVLLKFILFRSHSRTKESKELLVKAALQLVLERASHEDWKLRCDWLKAMGACPGSMLDVGQLAEGVLHGLMDHPITEQIEREAEELCSGHQSK